MAGRGQITKRTDGRWGFRVWSSSDIVATDGGQGYENKSEAREILQNLMSGKYDGPITEED